MKKIKSPLNYTGGKTRLLDKILPFFPENINNFVDLFAGGFNVGINISANKIYCNDNLTYVIDMFKEFRNKDFNFIINYINEKINEFQLSLTNEKGYKNFREYYNKNQRSLDLFILIAYSFNHQIRFNNNHKYNNPFGKNRSQFNERMKNNLQLFIEKLKEEDISFTSSCFMDYDYSFLKDNDFVYCDPPYLITTGSYNDGKRGFKGWGIKEEKALLSILDNLNDRKIKFALSNVLIHKGKKNEILNDWINQNNYNINNIKFNYANSNYQTLNRDKASTQEVLITNYKKIQREPYLFEKNEY